MMGPRKNLEYRQRRAVSRFARERRDGRGVEEPGVVMSERSAGVDVPEEAGVPTMGGRLDSIPVEVCLNSKVEGRVSFICRVEVFRRGKVWPITCTDARLRAILVIVAGEIFYLDCRRGHRKQAGVIFFFGFGISNG